MEESKRVDIAFSLCDNISRDATGLYEALADLEKEVAEAFIRNIEGALNTIKLRLESNEI